MTGVQKIIEQLRTRAVANRRAFKKGINAAAVFLKEESLKIVPRQTEELAESCKIIKNETASQFSASVTYTADHAVIVHENLEAAHGKKFNDKYATQIANAGPNDPYYFNRGPNEQAKYLETPVREKRSEIKAIIAKNSKS